MSKNDSQIESGPNSATSANKQSDEDLMRLLLDGDEHKKGIAFSEIYSRYHNKMIKFLFGFVYDFHLAEDLYQDAMIKLFNNYERFDTNEKFSSWFYRIVTNIALTYLKKNKKRDSIINEVNLDKHNIEIIDFREKNPESLYLNQEFWRKLSLIVSKLPEKFKTIFLIRFQNRESFKVIAEIFNLSERTVKWRMNKAIAIIKKNLKDEGF
jgi:RNA polymerase sigma-70 factor (ECF subfamily)